MASAVSATAFRLYGIRARGMVRAVDDIVAAAATGTAVDRAE
jgi:hypothetical protein